MVGGITEAHSNVGNEGGWVADDNIRDKALILLGAAADGSTPNTPAVIAGITSALLQQGAMINLTYDAVNRTLTIDNQNVTYTQGGVGQCVPMDSIQIFYTPFDPTTDPNMTVYAGDDWRCAGKGCFYRSADNTTWVTYSTYSSADDPFYGGSGVVRIIFQDHPTLIQNQVGQEIDMQATGSTGTYTWTVDALPTGMSMTTAGKITGTPTVVGSTACNFTATSAASSSTFRNWANIGVGGRAAAGTGSFTVSLNAPTPVVVGDMISVGIASGIISGTLAAWTVTDDVSGSNAYQIDDADSQSTNGQYAIISCRIAVAGTMNTLTITPVHSANNITVKVAKVTGVLGTGIYVDKVAHNTGSSASPSTGATSGTLSAATDLAVCVGITAAASTVSGGSGWIYDGTNPSSSGTNDKQVYMEHQFETTNAAVTGTVAQTTGFWAIGVVTYKAATGTSGGSGQSDSASITIVVQSSTGPGTPGNYAILASTSINASDTDVTQNGKTAPGFKTWANTLNATSTKFYGYCRGPYFTDVPADYTATTGGMGILAMSNVLPMPNITMASAGDITSILNGSKDTLLASYGASLVANTVQTLQHEPSKQSGSGPKLTPTEFIDSWNYMAHKIHDHALSSVKFVPTFICLDVTANYEYVMTATPASVAAGYNGGRGGLDLSLVAGWGLDVYPDIKGLIKTRVAPAYAHLVQILNAPLIIPEYGIHEKDPNSTLGISKQPPDYPGSSPWEDKMLESLKWVYANGRVTGMMAPIVCYFTGGSTNSGEVPTAVEISALATLLVAGS